MELETTAIMEVNCSLGFDKMDRSCRKVLDQRKTQHLGQAGQNLGLHLQAQVMEDRLLSLAGGLVAHPLKPKPMEKLTGGRIQNSMGSEEVEEKRRRLVVEAVRIVVHERKRKKNRIILQRRRAKLQSGVMKIPREKL